jgi:hypothetical protein
LNAVVYLYGFAYTKGDGVGDCIISNIQIEEGNTATEYTPYVDPSPVKVTRYGVDETDNPQTYTPAADGTCEIPSLSPTMTLLTDTEGVNIDLEYNQDTNRAFENVKEDIGELDRVMSEIMDDMGDMGESVPLPATAEIGQTVVVSAVDKDGKPTAWKTEKQVTVQDVIDALPIYEGEVEDV